MATIMNYSNLENVFNEFKLKNSEKNVFNILNPYSKKRVNQFEKDFKIKLPDDFKNFITKCSKGILNNKPGLSNIMDKIDLGYYRKKSNKLNPSLEFTHTKRIYSGSENQEIDKYYPYETIYVNDHLDYFHNGFNNGVIFIKNAGCLTEYFIVINGDEVGNIWCDNNSSNSEILPIFDEKTNKSRINFTEFIFKEINDSFSYFQ
ncbi:SMI1/KNR4 family protein [Psychroserpens sp. SPM9]|uniref:SMI1/KNR4 family protein n=1 Tax=Psychroserpens sp. SPM9 TaxID=2975598 RepID=UPI0021A7B4EF|nr:SMI1/KNR4 family protein [Psychroserpens sp. SPM9]MDG5493237.1 SMI1/KNR4 family protein [Psychroserpens sp. SPM9]